MRLLFQYHGHKTLWCIFALILQLQLITLQAQEIDFKPVCNYGEVVAHSYYTLCYSEVHEQPFWVAYMLTSAMVNENQCKRTDNFRPDPKVSTGSATLSDYKNSGFDRGHLCPAADMRFSCEAMSETFFMSNMSPQVPAFNRGIWSRLEEQVRNWAETYDTIYVTTAGVLNNTCTGSIGHHVAIPGYFYKALFRNTAEGGTCIAFLLPNKGLQSSLVEYVITVDSLENFTGIDFFSALPDSIEQAIEKESGIEKWTVPEK